MKRLKSYLSLLLTVMFVFSLTSCAKEGDDSNSDVTFEYKESQVKLPDDYTSILDMCMLQSGELRIAVSNQDTGNVSVFDSSDYGKSWNNFCDITKLLNLSKDSYTGVTLSNSGEIFCENIQSVKSDTDIFTSPKKYYFIDGKDYKTANVKLDEVSFDKFSESYEGVINDSSIKIINGISSCSFSQDGNILLTDYVGKGYCLDTSSWKTIVTYDINKDMNQVEDICNYKDYTIAVSYLGSLFYNYKDASRSSEGTLEKKMTEEISNASTNSINSGNYINVIKDTLYFYNSSGLYSYSDDNWELIDKCNASFKSNSGMYVSSLCVIDKDRYFLTVLNTDTNNSEIYMYSKEKSDESSSTLTVWSLKQSTAIENAINYYKRSNSSVTVNYEIGVGEDGATTIKDAISNLNTKILANDGPDVIMLDQMSIDTYIDNGYLLDISDLTNEFIESDTVFKNLANTYSKNNKVYAIPSRFAIMTIEGDKNTVEASSDISSLISYAEKLKSENPKVSVFEEDNFEYVAEYMYNASVSSWLNGDELNIEELKKFCSDLQKLYEIYDSPGSVSFEESGDNVYVGTDYYSLADGTLQIATDYVSSFGYQFAGINALTRYDSNCSYDIVNSSAGNIYLPMNIAGINSSSSNTEVAKEFIKTLLSYDVQKIAENDGAEPINKQAFESDLNDNYNIEMDALKLKSLTDEEKSKLISLVESLDTPVNRDVSVKDTVFEQLESCFNGSISLDEAEKNIINKLELYIKE